MASSGEKLPVDEDKLWQKAAEIEQRQYAECFPKSHMDVNTKSVVKSRIGVSIFGVPQTLPNDQTSTLTYKHYTEKEKKVIKDIAHCILKNQKEKDKKKIYISFVFVLGRTKCEKKIQFQEAIFKVPGKDGTKFIDKHCRVYQDWADYLENSPLPKATICYPVNGEYASKEDGFSVVFKDTSACSVKNDLVDGLDVVSFYAGTGAVLVSTATLFVPVAGPIMWTAYAASSLAGLYGAGRNIGCLVDRSKHDQTLSLVDSEARSAWLGATVPIFSIAAGVASAAARKLANDAVTAAPDSKQSKISGSTRYAINTINGIDCVARGVVLVHDFYSMYESKTNDSKVTKGQIFQCIASALLFANAIVRTHQARMLLQAIPNQGGDQGNRGELYKLLRNENEDENCAMIRSTVNVAINNTQWISTICDCVGIEVKIDKEILNNVREICEYLEQNGLQLGAGTGCLLALCYKLVESMRKRYNYSNNNHTYSDKNSPSEKNNRNESQYKFTKTSDMCKKETKSFNNEIKTQQTPRNGEHRCDHDDGDDKVQITITDMRWDGQQRLFDIALQNILDEGNDSIIDVLEASRLFFQRITADLADKESEFQTALQRNTDISERKLERIFGITGNRSQFFANKVMTSYTDVKLTAAKQYIQSHRDKKDLLVPVFSSPDCPIHLIYYKSTEREGTKKERFLKILEKAAVITSHANYTYFPSENSCFLQFNGQNSEFAMAGLVNFVEDNNLMGIIILQLKKQNEEENV